ncbi:hypothetical protein, partial [Bathymodiolus japonicus methanotrophic gill symbiont]|uniref:hypothetical protein n=1 Tax=Bathymodiolus japonicus methanotrophic gill symbiont TaxID=113269 RepID=UPI001C8E14CD
WSLFVFTGKGTDKWFVLYRQLICSLDYLKYLLTELPTLGSHYEPEALDQFLPWNLIEKIKPLK